MECLIHLNEICMFYVALFPEKKKKLPGTVKKGSLMRSFGSIRKLDLSKAISKEKLKVPISKWQLSTYVVMWNDFPVKKTKELGKVNIFRND